MGLGVPFNIASYALLTHMIAHVTGIVIKSFHLGFQNGDLNNELVLYLDYGPSRKMVCYSSHDLNTGQKV